jgi:hypothetical protein
LTVTNALAYKDSELITAVKSFKVRAHSSFCLSSMGPVSQDKVFSFKSFSLFSRRRKRLKVNATNSFTAVIYAHKHGTEQDCTCPYMSGQMFLHICTVMDTNMILVYSSLFIAIFIQTQYLNEPFELHALSCL